MMQNLIRSGLMRCSGTIITGAVLTMTTFFSLSSPIASNTNTTTVQAAQVKRNRVARRIEIDLSEQRLRAWEGNKVVYTTRISTGKRSTPTPVGTYRINSKYRTHRMRGRGYDIPDVPYAMYFYGGYAIHGAYWHKRFGTPVSHGCVNLPVTQARRLYTWTTLGTPVIVRR